MREPVASAVRGSYEVYRFSPKEAAITSTAVVDRATEK
jgi:hypothetical protein